MNRLLHRSLFLPCLMLATSHIYAQDLMRISRIVMAQQVDSSPAAVYPEDAKAAGIEGTVALDVVISARGTVEQVHVMSGPDKLREAAKQAVRKWTYKPYKIEDVAREVETTALVEFSLKDGGTSRNASGDAVETVTDARVASPANAVDANPKPDGPARVSSGVMAGNILHMERPIYPPQAKADHVSGSVVLHAIISKTGTIENLTVVSGDGRLQQAAIAAVAKWTYRPYSLKGQPTEVETTITVNFNFTSARPSTPTTYNPFPSGGFSPH